jgi:cysteine-rich CPXCG protein
MITPPDPLDDEFPLGDGTADTEAEVKCPYCGETVEITLDPGGGVEQEYVEDCQVCCRPWLVRVNYNASGGAEVEVEASDDAESDE